MNLPDGFGYLLLVLGLILTLSPWLHGHDFGLLKVPDFNASQRRFLKGVGPIALVVAITLHVPILSAGSDARPGVEVPPTIGPGDEAQRPSVDDSPADDSNPQHVLAEWEGSKCLYLANLLGRDADMGRVSFAFDPEISDIPLSHVYIAATPEISVGAQLYAKLLEREAWLPVTVEEFRQHNVKVTRSEDALCAAEFGDATKWVPRETLSDVQSIGD